MIVLREVVPTPEQLKVIRDDPGVSVIYGAAGSGKTTTALLRMRFLVGSWMRRSRRLGVSEPLRVLVLTYNRTLRGYIEELARGGPFSAPGLDIEIKTFAKWAKDRLELDSSRILDLRLRSRRLEMLFSTFTQEDRFLNDELEYVSGRFLPEEIERYITCERTGRGTVPRCDRSFRREFLDSVVSPYAEWKRSINRFDFADMAAMLANTPPQLRYQVVVLDEAQDFSANEVRAILRHLDDPHSITFVLDGAQRIYPKGFAWQEVGLRVLPHLVYKLQENHRNTKQIAALVRPVLVGVDIGGMEGSIPDLNSCSRDGEMPVLLCGKYSDQMAWVIRNLLPRVDLTAENVAFLKPRAGQWFNTLRKGLTDAGYDYVELTREDEWPQGPENIALSTMHSAKGLEFDHVVILGLSQEVTPHEDEQGNVGRDALRRLFAMACTRARKTVTVGFKPGEASLVINALNPATYTEIRV